MCITPVLGVATAPGYLWKRFLHSEIRSPQAKLPAKTCESLFPRLFVSFVLYFYPKQIQRVKKKIKKEKRKKDTRKSLCNTEHSPPKEGNTFIKLQVAKSVCYVGV